MKPVTHARDWLCIRAFRIKLLASDPTAGLQCFNNSSQCTFRSSKMHQHQPNMCEIKLVLGEVLVPNIVATHFQIRVRKGLKEPWTNICSEHPSSNADSGIEPGSDRSSPPPTSRQSPPLSMPRCSIRRIVFSSYRLDSPRYRASALVSALSSTCLAACAASTPFASIAFTFILLFCVLPGHWPVRK